jgi:hypothetical protein
MLGVDASGCPAKLGRAETLVTADPLNLNRIMPAEGRRDGSQPLSIAFGPRRKRRMR